MLSKRILLLAGLVWLADAMSKVWANRHLTSQVTTVVPNFFYMVLGKNPGGSVGLGNEWMEVCLTLPAVLVVLIFAWLTKKEKAGIKPTQLQQIGFACLTGGTIANWAERVLYHSVTDFCYTTLYDKCIWNLADLFITGGFAVVALETFRVARRHRLQAVQSSQNEQA
ncbi:MAG TPA: signal peptidase II [Candidatus Obscuribacterales bacterium]